MHSSRRTSRPGMGLVNQMVRNPDACWHCANLSTSHLRFDPARGSGISHHSDLLVTNDLRYKVCFLAFCLHFFIFASTFCFFFPKNTNPLNTGSLASSMSRGVFLVQHQFNKGAQVRISYTPSCYLLNLSLQTCQPQRVRKITVICDRSSMPQPSHTPVPCLETIRGKNGVQVGEHK